MTLSKSARYALYAAIEMARAGERRITVADVALPYRIPATALAKVLQQLVRAGLAESTRGVGGGYRLARPGDQVTVLDITNLFEPPRPAARLPLLEEIDELVDGTLASVTLTTLARPTPTAATRPTGLTSPTTPTRRTRPTRPTSPNRPTRPTRPTQRA